MIDAIKNLDYEALIYLNSFHNEFFDKFMWIITGTKIWFPFYLFIIFVLFRKFNIRLAATFLLMVLLVVALADFGSVNFFKEVFQRLRPSHNPIVADLLHFHVKENGDIYRGGLYGFVSSHAANTFGIAAILSLIFKNKKFAIGIFLWATIVSYSRIYLGVHFPLDIIGGALWGIFSAYFFYYCFVFLRKTEFYKIYIEKKQIPGKEN